MEVDHPEGGPSLGSVLRRFVGRFLKFHDLSLQQYKVVRAIMHCKTPALGGHEFECEDCERHYPIYHSCRDRHCPQCQHYKSQQWLEKQLANVLPVPYFHVVFTLAEQLNLVFRYNAKRLYNLFFAKSAETLQEFAAKPEHLGAELGFMGILHTWGSALPYHPHLHWVVPQGGIDAAGRWVRPKYPGEFLFPVVAMSQVFRGKMLRALQRLYERGQLNFPDELTREQFPDQLRIAASKKWNIEIRKPFAGPEPFLSYVGRYTHRVAITSSRLLQADHKEVSFRYKDYRQGGVWREMTLTGMEFVRRFVQHILPKGFQRIRYYGWMVGRKQKRGGAASEGAVGAAGPMSGGGALGVWSDQAGPCSSASLSLLSEPEGEVARRIAAPVDEQFLMSTTLPDRSHRQRPSGAWQGCVLKSSKEHFRGLCRWWCGRGPRVLRARVGARAGREPNGGGVHRRAKPVQPGRFI